MTHVSAQFPDGAAYERLMGRWSRLAGQDFLTWLAPQPGQAWLDVGCGNGAFTQVIDQEAKPRALTGIDPAPAQIAYARNRLPGAAFHVGDAQDLPFQDAQFDLAVMALVVAFVPDPARALAEQARVTRPGGMIATYMWDLPAGGLPLTPLFRALAHIGHASPFPPSAAFSTQAALMGLWQGAGLTDLRQTVIEITVHFDDFQDFWASNTLSGGPQSAILASLSPQERAAVQDHLRANLPSDAQGRIAYPARANAISGRRPG